ncbi:hypothetical protein LXA43DRAFT_1021170, partial [Ganoderma leucocontextum]
PHEFIRDRNRGPRGRHFRPSRICPGRHFAESTMFILCAFVLSAFKIGSPVGEDGAPVEFKREVMDKLQHRGVSGP